MWNWKPTFWEAILLIVFVIISTVTCFPCWVLQKLGFKAKLYARFLCKTGLEDLSIFVIKVYHIK